MHFLFELASVRVGALANLRPSRQHLVDADVEFRLVQGGAGDLGGVEQVSVDGSHIDSLRSYDLFERTFLRLGLTSTMLTRPREGPTVHAYRETVSLRDLLT